MNILLILAAICFFMKWLGSIIPALSIDIDLVALGLFLWALAALI